MKPHLLILSGFLLLPATAQELLPPPSGTSPLAVAPPVAPSEAADIYRSVVRIEVATQVSDYQTPWNSGRFGGGTGSGFLIGPNRFLTNAHVVSNARRILINERGSSVKHPAKVIHVAHDCDLAILEVEDPAPFAGLKYLEFGDVPPLESQVRVIGYPVGGDRISVTRGVVSRIDFRPYAHSQVDSHLVVQIDAAINPGNSGGPVLQDGKVVGVAFQGLRQADNTGYMIPTPVIRRFLKDVEDGEYDHYVDLGAAEFPLFNPAMRKALQLPDNGLGVLVASVTPTGPCDGVLQAGDVLLSIDGKPIDNAGNIEVEGEKVVLHEIVERKFQGDTVNLEFQRAGEQKQATITLTSFPAARIFALSYGERPRYVFFCGLTFQPLDLNLYATHQFSNPRVRKTYQNYVKDSIFKEREDVVILTRVESDSLTSHLGEFAGTVVEEINGQKISTLDQVHELLYADDQPEFITIKCEGSPRPIVIPAAEAKDANKRIMQSNGIYLPYYLDKPSSDSR
ncbi:MAG: trypsin-like peptidase domain-containing protein [Verrucomicrobia bacterium]|nr:trypsin-like peptidase domain-containing protein [Verrucomicrobiota bacterium]MDA1006711.1 trypsin-like peptidase domain-containing protein [Verrucomicrobiota bacterium]